MKIGHTAMYSLSANGSRVSDTSPPPLMKTEHSQILNEFVLQFYLNEYVHQSPLLTYISLDKAR